MNQSSFWLLHKSGKADEPGRVPYIETNSSRKEQRPESTAGGVRPPISAFPSRFSPVLQHSTDRWHAAKSTPLGLNSYGTQFPFFWIIPMALRCFEKPKIPENDENLGQKLTSSRINLWCNHNFTNVVLSLYWQILCDIFDLPISTSTYRCSHLSKTAEANFYT